MLSWEVIAVCDENHMKHTNTLCEQNEEFLNVTARGIYSYHCTLKDSKEDYKELPLELPCCISKYLHSYL
jgi:hypothetical protein